MLTRNLSTKAMKVFNNVARQQFSVCIRDNMAILDYKKTDKEIIYLHTNVPQDFQGKGVGKLLAKYALDFAHAGKLNVICKCHFLATYYEKNRDKYQGLNIVFELE